MKKAEPRVPPSWPLGMSAKFRRVAAAGATRVCRWSGDPSCVETGQFLASNRSGHLGANFAVQEAVQNGYEETLETRERGTTRLFIVVMVGWGKNLGWMVDFGEVKDLGVC